MGNSLTAQNSVTTTRTQTDKLDAATRSPDPPPATERRARRQCTTTHAPAIRTTRTTRASRKHALTPAASTVPAAVDSCWKPPRRAVDDVNTDPRRSFDLAVGLLRADTKRTQRPRPSAKTPSQSRRRCNGGETWNMGAGLFGLGMVCWWWGELWRGCWCWRCYKEPLVGPPRVRRETNTPEYTAGCLLNRTLCLTDSPAPACRSMCCWSVVALSVTARDCLRLPLPSSCSFWPAHVLHTSPPPPPPLSRAFGPPLTAP